MNYVKRDICHVTSLSCSHLKLTKQVSKEHGHTPRSNQITKLNARGQTKNMATKQYVVVDKGLQTFQRGVHTQKLPSSALLKILYFRWGDVNGDSRLTHDD